MITAYRRTVIAGPLIALALIAAAAALGAAVGAGRWEVAGGTAFRLLVDVLIVIGTGVVAVASRGRPSTGGTPSCNRGRPCQACSALDRRRTNR